MLFCGGGQEFGFKKEENEEKEEKEDPAVPSMEPPPAVIMGAVYERWGRLGCDPYRGGGKKADGRISASRQLLLLLLKEKLVTTL